MLQVIKQGQSTAATSPYQLHEPRLQMLPFCFVEASFVFKTSVSPIHGPSLIPLRVALKRVEVPLLPYVSYSV